VLESLDLERAGADDRLRLATVHIQAGWLRFSNENDVERGRALVERGLRVLQDLPGGGDMQLLGLSYLTRIDALDGELARSLASARRLAECATARGDRPSLALARYNECLALCDAGRIAEARAVAEDALALASDSGNELLVGMAQSALARVQYFEGDAAAALAGTARVEALARRSGQVGFLSHALAVRGYAHLLRGDARAGREAFEALGALDARWPSTLLHRARGALEIGEFTEAAELARRALDAPRGVRARASALLGLALGLSGGARAEAEHFLADAVDLCDRLGLRPWLAEALAFQSELYARWGDATRAAHYRARAAEGYALCGMRGHAASMERASETGL
jgi:tetratricopeptide (TPR) repeat protein